MWFDKVKCEGGLEALKWYHEKYDDVRAIGMGPNHDWSSHAADSFGLMAVAYEAPRPYNMGKPKVNSSMKGRRMYG
jgi:phage terminase large subunit